MKFRKWIADQGGPTAVGRLLGITHATVCGWLVRKSTPKAITMVRIVELAGGKLTFADVINETKPKKASRK